MGDDPARRLSPDHLPHSVRGRRDCHGNFAEPSQGRAARLRRLGYEVGRGRRGRWGNAIVIGAVRSFSISFRETLTHRPDRVRTGVEIMLAVVLAIQLARLILIVAQPQTGPAAAPTAGVAAAPVDYSVFQRFDAFFRTGGQSSLAEASAAGSSQMRLFGVRGRRRRRRLGHHRSGRRPPGLRRGRRGGRARPGAPQSVGPDHVTLARGGIGQPADLQRRFRSASRRRPPPPPGPQTVDPAGPPVAAPAVAADAAVVDPGPTDGPGVAAPPNARRCGSTASRSPSSRRWSGAEGRGPPVRRRHPGRQRPAAGQSGPYRRPARRAREQPPSPRSASSAAAQVQTTTIRTGR
jgi:general secretion pathway protein C